MQWAFFLQVCDPFAFLLAAEQPRLGRGRHAEAGLHGGVAAQGEADAQAATHGTARGFFPFTLSLHLCLFPPLFTYRSWYCVTHPVRLGTVSGLLACNSTVRVAKRIRTSIFTAMVSREKRPLPPAGRPDDHSGAGARPAAADSGRRARRRQDHRRRPRGVQEGRPRPRQPGGRQVPRGRHCSGRKLGSSTEQIC